MFVPCFKSNCHFAELHFSAEAMAETPSPAETPETPSSPDTPSTHVTPARKNRVLTKNARESMQLRFVDLQAEGRLPYGNARQVAEEFGMHERTAGREWKKVKDS